MISKNKPNKPLIDRLNFFFKRIKSVVFEVLVIIIALSISFWSFNYIKKHQNTKFQTNQKK